MLIEDVLRRKGRDVVRCSPEMQVKDVVELLAQRNIGAVPVVENGRILGMVSERDIVRAIAAEGKAALDRSAADVMRREVATVSPADSLRAVASIMTDGKFRHVCVMEGELAGLVSIGDVVFSRMLEVEREAHELRDYIVAG